MLETRMLLLLLTKLPSGAVVDDGEGVGEGDLGVAEASGG